MNKEIKTQEELLEKLNMLGIEDEERRNKITCALIGHSLIQTTFFGYYYCSRCGEGVREIAKGHKNKRLKKEIKRLRHMNRILKAEKESWKQRYEELNRYVEMKHKDYV